MTTITLNRNVGSASRSRSAQSRRVLSGAWRQPFWPTDVYVSDWIALGLLAWMLAMVTWAVDLARWGELPNLIPTAVIAAIIAFVMAKNRTSIYTKVAVFLIAGIATVFWQGSLNAEGSNALARSNDAWDRFALWIDVAINGGISADQVPFAMLMMTATWIVAYATTTLTFRYYNPWIPSLVLGLALLVNLSHRIGQHEHTFYLFMIGAVAQFAHLVAIRRVNEWKMAKLRIPKEARWVASRDGLILATIVIVFAAILPLALPRSQPLRTTWNAVFLNPITQFRSTAERLLAGVPSGDDDRLYFPNAVLPFQGGIELTDDPIMWVRSPYAKLHPARVYQEYTPQGWVTAPSISLPADANTKLIDLPDDLGITNRERVEIIVEPLGNTELVIPAAAVHAVDNGVQVEVLEPQAWDVPLTGSPAALAELPDDLRDFAFQLRDKLREIAEDASPGTVYTLSTQPAMSARDIGTAIRNLRSGVIPIGNLEEQITYSITSSSLEEMELSANGAFESMTFKISGQALLELISGADNTPDTIAFRVSTVALRERANLNNGNGPRNLSFLISPEDLASISENGALPNGSTGTLDWYRFTITQQDLNVMDLSGSGIPWDTFNFRIYAGADGSSAELMRIARNGPTEQNTVTFQELREKHEVYAVSTYVSTAEDSDLATMSDIYPPWISDRYLSLPDTVSSEIYDLTNRIIADAGAITPWEKTQAIKAFLQSQVYSLEIEGPGPFDDGVYYFLFETIAEPCPSELPNCDTSKRKGYSQYFGTAGTVMLRIAGVPSRMVQGWSAGEYVPDQGQFLIRDRNRHGWTQIYATGYGWIDVEVTPGRPAAPRNVIVPTTPTSTIPFGLIGSAEFDPDYLLYLEDLDDLALQAQDFLRSRQTNAQQQTSWYDPSNIPVVPTSAAASILALVFVLTMIWRWNLRQLPAAVRAYTQLTRVCNLLGYRRPRSASAREYLNYIGRIAERDVETQRLLVAYEGYVYGPQTASSEVTPAEDTVDPVDDAVSDGKPVNDEPKVISRSWRRIARSVLKHRVKRLFGLTPRSSIDAVNS